MEFASSTAGMVSIRSSCKINSSHFSFLSCLSQPISIHNSFKTCSTTFPWIRAKFRLFYSVAILESRCLQGNMVNFAFPVWLESSLWQLYLGGGGHIYPFCIWRLDISPPWLYLEADHISSLAMDGGWPCLPFLYLEAGHVFDRLYLEADQISSLAIPGGWPYLLPVYTWRLAISPPWLYLENGHISSLATPGGWPYLLPSYTWRLCKGLGAFSRIV
jgi:hypothetical protein